MRFFLSFALLFLPLSFTGCTSIGHHEAGIDNFDQVSETLFRGGQPTPEGIQTLARYHVKTVINLRGDGDAQEAQMVRQAGMTYLHFPLDAETVTPADGEKFLQLLASAPTPVFVHCHVGRDRTGLAIAAYRVRVQGWNEQAALRDLNNHGHFWLLFPKVRESVATIAKAAPSEPPLSIKTTPSGQAVPPTD